MRRSKLHLELGSLPTRGELSSRYGRELLLDDAAFFLDTAMGIRGGKYDYELVVYCDRFGGSDYIFYMQA